MKVLVYGATGSQQEPVVRELLKQNHQVLAVTHNPDKLGYLDQMGAKGVVADMADYARLVQISNGVDAVALLVPFFIADPLDGMKFAQNAIDAAVNAGVKLLVWNSSGFIPAHATGNPAIDNRIYIRDYLKSSPLPSIILQPSVYAENLLGPWTAPFVVNENKVAYPTPEEMPIGWIATKDVAAFVAAAIERPHLAGKEFLLSGLENLTGDELAERFSEGLQREIRFHSLPPYEFGAILDGLFGPGAGKGAAEEYQRIAASKAYPVLYTDMQPVLEQLPVSMTNLSQWVKEHKSSFSPSLAPLETAIR